MQLSVCVFLTVFGAEVWGRPLLAVVDLTHQLDSNIPIYTGGPPFVFTQIYRGLVPPENYWFELNQYSTLDHAGTHIDAPSHFNDGGARTQDVPLSQLIGPGVVIDVKNKVDMNNDYRVTVKDIHDWENRHGPIPPRAIVIMNSGWDTRFASGDASQAFGTATPDNPATFVFPGWSPEAVSFLISERQVNVVGTDTPSVDAGQAAGYPVHLLLGAANIVGVENVANLDQIPPSGTEIFCVVSKIFNSSGGQARVFARFWERSNGPSSG